MTTPVSSIPLSVDYTSRDFYALREDLINLVKARVNIDGARQWSGDDPSDFGVAMVESFAYLGDITNYYIDRIANETYLPTATQRKNIINLARLYGYVPTGYRAAELELTFTNTSTTNEYSIAVTGATGTGTQMTYTANGHEFVVGDFVTVSGVTPSGYNVTNAVVVAKDTNTFTVTGATTASYTSGGLAVKSYLIPTGTQVSASVVCDDVVEELIFTTLYPIYVPPKVGDSVGTATGYARHGESVALRAENLSSGAPGDISGELIGTSDGTPNQILVLSENQVVDKSVQIFVQAGDVYQPWTEVTQMSDYGPTDTVYRTETDENNFVYVVFGDGISGAIPNNFAGIKAVYSVGGGSIGNIALGLISTIVQAPGITAGDFNQLIADVSVSNTTVGLGGSDPEDNRSIRLNASRAIRAINRAVSLQDYGSLALFTTNCGKANADANVWTSITLYVAPVRNVDDTDLYPGFNDSNSTLTTEWTTLQTDVEQQLADKTQVGVTVTVAPPKYVNAVAQITYSKSDQYTQSQAETEIKEAVLTNFSYAYSDFAQTITPEQIESLVNSLDSVRAARVTLLHRQGATANRTVLIGQPDEIFIFKGDFVSTVEASDDADLSALTTSSGTLSPVFSAGVVGYNLTSVSTTTITITPTASDTDSTIIVNAIDGAGDVLVSGAIVDSGTASPSIATPTGMVGPVKITIVVVAPDLTTSKVYNISVFRP